MTRLDTRKCFGRYDGAALDYRDDGGNDEDEDGEDGYDDDVCRLSLPTTSLGWPHQLLKLIGVGPQEAAVEAEKVYQMEYTSLGQQQRNQVYCHYDHDFFSHYDHDDNGNNQVDNT